MIWKEGLSSPKDVQASVLLRESTLDSRLNALKEIALSLLNGVESLKSAEPPRPNRSLRLQDEVQRFETELIRCALERTGGNQVRAARILGVKHTTLNAKIKRYKISFAGRNVENASEAQAQGIAA
jgi:transcriptional regulator with GAF, ATPase, and Fis domain